MFWCLLLNKPYNFCLLCKKLSDQKCIIFSQTSKVLKKLCAKLQFTVLSNLFQLPRSLSMFCCFHLWCIFYMNSHWIFKLLSFRWLALTAQPRKEKTQWKKWENVIYFYSLLPCVSNTINAFKMGSTMWLSRQVKGSFSQFYCIFYRLKGS